ncbi:MAG: glycerol-3-phosphate acyltransferase [Bacillota bacterium]
MENLILIVVAYMIGVVPNIYLLRGFIDKERLKLVRADKVGPYYVFTHLKEPAFFMTLLLDLIKGAVLVLLAQWLGSFGPLPIVMLLFAVIARNFNPIIGIRNGLGVAIVMGSLLVYAPLVVLIFAVATSIFYIGIRDLETSLALATTSIPISLGLLVDSLLVLLISIILVIVIIIHKRLFIHASAVRLKYDDNTRNNPFRHSG